MLTFLGSLGAIILVDLTLSGDNALVIGAAAAGLPRRRRLWAILLGGGSAIVLRVIFAAAATLLLTLPLLSAIGGGVLFVIAARLLMERGHESTSVSTNAQDSGASSERTFGRALLTILIADVTMSLDNILAVGGLAHGDLLLLGVGLLISIGLLMVGSALVAELVGRLPWLLDVAALVLGWTGGTMVWHDHVVGSYLARVPFGQYVTPAIGVAIVLVVDIVVRALTRRRQAGNASEHAARETTIA
ncbi:MAG TPA: YjbE family putative metal transport protein [Ktedonobacterales bacterium]